MASLSFTIAARPHLSHPSRSGGVRAARAPPSLVVCAAGERTSHVSAPGMGRREALASAVATATTAATAATAPPARAAGKKDLPFVKAGGIEYFDSVVGDGGEAFDGDTIKIYFTAHTYDPETGKKVSTFDPFVLGSPGSSIQYGFKLTLGGGATGDIIPGWNLGMVGGDGVPPMRKGGERVIRVPPSLAYGSEGHLCIRNIKEACAVPPDTPVEIEVVFIDFS